MIVVSDASPLHYLVLIDQASLLPAIFGRVLTTPIVIAELGRPEAPAKLREWLAPPPGWLEVRTPHSVPASSRLDPGEIEAIALAHELQADALAALRGTSFRHSAALFEQLLRDQSDNPS